MRLILLIVCAAVTFALGYIGGYKMARQSGQKDILVALLKMRHNADMNGDAEVAKWFAMGGELTQRYGVREQLKVVQLAFPPPTEEGKHQGPMPAGGAGLPLSHP